MRDDGWAAAHGSDAQLEAGSFLNITICFTVCRSARLMTRSSRLPMACMPSNAHGSFFAWSYERRETTEDFCKYSYSTFREENLAQNVSRAGNYS
jgi:hypothetical protein